MLHIRLAPSLAATPLCGRTIGEHWAVLSDDLDAIAEGVDLTVDGRFPLVEVGSLAAAAERALALVAADGSVVAEPVGPLAGELRLSATESIAVAEPRAHGADNLAVHRAEAELQRRIIENAIHHGVRFVRPETSVIDATVQFLGPATIGPGVVLRGLTRVGEGASIDAYCVLDDTEVGTGARVLASTVCSGARIGPGAHVGPMAHLRADADIREGARVGNFVEVKKAILGPGAKANHLTYLGDAEIGEKANIGAGTITCNYDGFHKHRTVVGARAFVGSNTAIVAPSTIGAGAVIGAGSVVVGDVPDDALYVARGRPHLSPGRAATLRARLSGRNRDGS